MWVRATMSPYPHGATMVCETVPSTGDMNGIVVASLPVSEHRMSQNDIDGRILSSGLRKVAITEAAALLSLVFQKIHEGPLHADAHVAEWRKGSFSWIFVREVECWANVFFNDLEFWTMVANGKKNKKRTPLDAYSFVRSELRTEDKKAAKKWIDDNTKDMASIVHDVVASDYKLSLSFSSEHDTFTVSVTGKEDAVNAYKILTARHKDWVVATMTVLFKHLVLFQGGVWESDDDEDDGWS